MALLTCEFFGKSIEKRSSCVVITPDLPGRGPYPVLYLLHGLSDNHTAWQRWTNIERYVGGYRMIVVMPDAHRSFYVNAPKESGLAYEDHIVKDVVDFVDRTFHTVRGRQGRALVGLSMGGYGALMLALKNPGKFCAASSHSGAVFFGHQLLDEARKHIWAGLIGNKYPGGPYDLFALARRRLKQENRPALRLDCGRNDPLIQYNRALDKHLTAIRYPHIYREYPGRHDWDYWDAHIRESIDFACKHLRMTKR